jgi:hypothetical protein
MAVCYSGALERADEALAPIRALGPPVVDLLREQPYVELQSYLDATEPKGRHYYWRTAYVAELADELLETLEELAASCPIPDADAFRAWVRAAGERCRPFTTGASYVNFQTADEDDERVRATYGPNLERLLEVKRRYDPGNLMRVNRNVRP